jgi:hypothetical protein
MTGDEELPIVVPVKVTRHFEVVFLYSWRKWTKLPQNEDSACFMA